MSVIAVPAWATPSWKNFPRYMVLAMGLVVAVNVRFIYVAVSTFPGAATQDDFDTSNRYNAVMDAAAAQAALGWRETATTTGRHVTLDVSGPDHAPLSGATLTVQTVRPLGDTPALPFPVLEARPGHFIGVMDLPAAGQWDLVLRVSQHGHVAHVTRRVVTQ
jgi:nitrogen fixation protein FixH